MRLMIFILGNQLRKSFQDRARTKRALQTFLRERKEPSNRNNGLRNEGFNEN